MEKYLAIAQMDNHKAIKMDFPDTKIPINTRSSALQQKELYPENNKRPHSNKILEDYTLGHNFI